MVKIVDGAAVAILRRSLCRGPAAGAAPLADSRRRHLLPETAEDGLRGALQAGDRGPERAAVGDADPERREDASHEGADHEP